MICPEAKHLQADHESKQSVPRNIRMNDSALAMVLPGMLMIKQLVMEMSSQARKIMPHASIPFMQRA